MKEFAGNGKRYTGYVLFYDHHRNFGFVECDASKDIFIHADNFEDTSERVLHVRKGQKLSFEIETKNKKGPSGAKIRFAQNDRI